MGSLRRIGIASLLLATALALAGALTLHGAWTRTRGPAAGDSVLVIPSGSGTRQIASQLARAGVLERPRLFVWGARLSGSGEVLRAGRYRFTRPSPPAEVLSALRRGDTEKLWLTLPEGLWLDEAVGLIAREMSLDSLALARLVRQPEDWDRSFLAGRGDLEGFLYPDTYAFEYPVREEQVLARILDRFAEVLAQLQSELPAVWPFALDEWVTLASIVEAETPLADERSRVAAVYRHRLRRGMRLEADPTVIYGLGTRRARLYYKDLRSDSPYNTYRNGGLPPGPICSPGQSSLRAVIEADPDDPHLYFVATGEGGHVFSRTFAEHQRHVRALRQKTP